MKYIGLNLSRIKVWDPGFYSFMYILGNSLISIGSSIKEELCLQEIRTDGRMDKVIDSYIPPKNTLFARGKITYSRILW